MKDSDTESKYLIKAQPSYYCGAETCRLTRLATWRMVT